jgi:hypothetical protein
MPSHTMWGWVKNTAPHYASRLKNLYGYLA